MSGAGIRSHPSDSPALPLARPRGMGLTARLILALVVSGAIIFTAVFSFNFVYTSRMVEQQIMAHGKDVVEAAVRHIDELLQEVEKGQQALVEDLGRKPLSSQRVNALLPQFLATHQEVFGTTVAFAPGSAAGRQAAYAPYYYRSETGEIGYLDLARGGARDFSQQEWYAAPKLRGVPVWSEPYFDEGGGNIVMTTHSIPLYRDAFGERQFAGVSTVDISVDWLGAKVSSLKLYRNAYAALFSRQGVYLAHPDRSLVLQESIFSMGRRVNSPVIQEIGRAIGRQEAGFVKAKNIRGVESWIYYSPIPTTGWSLAVVFPAEAMLADVRAASRVIALICVGGFVLLVLSIVPVARSATRPIVEMTGAARRIAAGDLESELPVAGVGGEVGELSAAFVKMQQDLKTFIAQLTETTAAKERMANELAIAHEMQMAMLPTRLPTLAGAGIHGFSQPAREVGGDFYDVRQLDANHLFCIIGDVSGKGVPAALYMAVTVSLARALAGGRGRPAEILGRLNHELSRDNESCMFVTIFCGILDTITGKLVYANAGHNPPVLVEADGGVGLLEIAPGLVAGCTEDYVYGEAEYLLAPGASLLLYTDGVTEAKDGEGRFFGEARLLAAAGRGAASAEQLVAAVREAVAGFTAGAEQFDDITLLAIRAGDGGAGQ